jgi:ferredoxin
MTKVRFISADGRKSVEAVGAAGTRLLELAQANDQPLEGACEGAMACSTCHVIIAEGDFAKLPPSSDEEEDMLDFAYGVSRTSRLACQIFLADDIDSLEVRMPGGSANMQRR